MTDGAAFLLRGDARRIPLADASVDLIITSPPFYALRSYTDAGEHYQGQLGDEPTPAEFLANLWAATREMARVLKPSGSMFIELGDKYSERTGGKHASSDGAVGRGPQAGIAQQSRGPMEKSLLGLPWAFALGCTGALAMLGGPDPGLNLILRAEVIWEHVNGLPESVTDRVRRSHSTWFHLVKQPRYYAGVDEIRTPPSDYQRNGRNRSIPDGQPRRNILDTVNPLGALPGSVWSIPSEPLRVPEHLGIDHYAAFPTEWPRRLILAFSPPGICCECNQGRAPVVDKRAVEGKPFAAVQQDSGRGWHGGDPAKRTLGIPAEDREATILGYACACTPSTLHAGTGESSGRGEADWSSAVPREHISGARQGNAGRGLNGNPKVGPWREYHLEGWKAPPTRPAVVLDPFVGTGTTVGVAKTLGRIGIGVDLSADYLRLATWRVFHSGDFGKAEARTWRERQGALL